jgi:hypothetical protein
VVRGGEGTQIQRGGASYGGAVTLLGSAGSVSRCVFECTHCVGGTLYGTAYGGALQASGAPQLSVSGAVFRDNVARGGDGLGISQGGWSEGGAVSLADTPASFSRSLFVSNQSVGGADGGNALGGALRSDCLPGDTQSLDVTRCIFVLNQAIGGAASCDIEMGTADGGAACVSPAESLTMTSSLVHHNSAIGSTGRGGGLFLYDMGTGSALIRRSSVTGNFASTEGDDIFGPYGP